MNSRERVAKLFAREEADRCCIDLGGTFASGIHLRAYADLRRALQLPSRPLCCHDVMEQLACVDSDVANAVGSDFTSVDAADAAEDFVTKDFFHGLPCAYPAPLDVTEREDGFLLRDAQKNEFFQPRDGFYFDALTSDAWYGIPLAPSDNAALDRLERRTRARFESCEQAIVANFGGCFISTSTEFLMNLLLEPEKVHAELANRCDALIGLYSALWPRIGKYTCCITNYSDFGTQNAPLMSPDSFREVIKPHMARFFRFIKDNTDWKIVLHSCGAVEPLIEDFIDCGIDALNPVQTSARGMGMRLLKKKYGKRLIFWGGGVDTQATLGRVSGEALCEHVRERLRVFGEGGGYVFAPVHDVQSGVSGEEVKTVYTCAREFRRAGGATSGWDRS